jgi:glycosyltransferase involved in cell wall biosynthesis
MDITFVLPSFELAGGVRAVFELSNQLVLRGNRVRIVHCAISPWDDITLNAGGSGNIRQLIRFAHSLYRPKLTSWFSPLLADTIRIPRLRAHHFPDGDILIATAWPTAEEVFRADSRKGKKIYFIQNYELWSGPEDRVKATYRLPLKNITISSFLIDTLKKEVGVHAYGPVIMGVDFDQFNRSCRHLDSSRRIGMLYHRLPLKGVQDGLKAFEIVKNKHPDIRLIMFGAYKHPRGLPENVEYYYNLPQHMLKHIYGSCGIWMVPSHLEGCCLIPLEAMACGCAVVSTRIGGIDDYTIPGETALVSNPGDVNGLAANLNMLLNDNNLLLKIAERGFLHGQQFSWTKAADNFIKLLVD